VISKDLISIIIPVYNVEPFLSICLQSVLLQDYENLEIIIINDGSTDASYKICESFSENDSRIKLINQKNLGLSAARNSGLKIAKGEWIIFLDSDDWIAPNFCSILLNLAQINNADIAVSNFVKVFDNKIAILSNLKSISIFFGLEILQQLYTNLYIQFVVAWGKLIKKEIYNDLKFPIGKLHEDEFVAHHVLSNAKIAVYTSQELLFYRQRFDSITGKRKKTNNFLDAIEAHQNRSSFLKDRKLHMLDNLNNKRIFFLIYGLLSSSNIDYQRKNFKKQLKKYFILIFTKNSFLFKVKYTYLYLKALLLF
jgi:glycosyltransferase involved in cell wall biosynthesis